MMSARRTVSTSTALLALALLSCRAEGPSRPAVALPASEVDPATPPTDGASGLRGELDAVFARRWAKAGVDVAPRCTDDAFLRRATLDLTGRVPTPEQRADFLSQSVDTRRAAVVDRMLASDAFVEHWARRHAQLLLGNEEGIQPRFVAGLERWAADALREGDGWDDMVRELLTAQGELDEAPAGVFVAALSRQGQEAAVAAKVSESILGVQIECAQCHDHPYDDYQREDFWGMAAYFARTRVRVDRSRMENRGPVFRVVDRPRGETRIATEVGGVRDTKVMPRFLGAADEAALLRPAGRDRADDRTRRAVFAERVLASDLTSRAAVGRVWTDLFGTGLQEPWNDLGGPGRESKAPPEPALELLARGLVDHEWDLRWLLRTIVLSEAYGRASTGIEEGRVAAEAAFARARVRPLSADQIYASMMTVAGFELHTGRRFRLATGERRQATIRQVQALFPAPGEQTGSGGEVTVAQALWLQNGGLTNAAPLEDARGELGVLLDGLSHGDADETQLSVQLEALFHRVYGRDPLTNEREGLSALLAAEPAGPRRRQAWEDIAFALLTSTEFVTNH